VPATHVSSYCGHVTHTAAFAQVETQAGTIAALSAEHDKAKEALQAKDVELTAAKVCVCVCKSVLICLNSLCDYHAAASATLCACHLRERRTKRLVRGEAMA
jgi:hypothetical protein